MTLEEAWATGLFEGEGSITFPTPACTIVRLRVSSTDFDVIQRIQALWGGKVYPSKVYQAHYKPKWEWNLNRKADVRKALNTMIPFLQTRRGYTAQNALDVLDKI